VSRLSGRQRIPRCRRCSERQYGARALTPAATAPSRGSPSGAEDYGQVFRPRNAEGERNLRMRLFPRQGCSGLALVWAHRRADPRRFALYFFDFARFFREKPASHVFAPRFRGRGSVYQGGRLRLLGAAPVILELSFSRKARSWRFMTESRCFSARNSLILRHLARHLSPFGPLKPAKKSTRKSFTKNRSCAISCQSRN
jgi:hypothetical protein